MHIYIYKYMFIQVICQKNGQPLFMGEVIMDNPQADWTQKEAGRYGKEGQGVNFDVLITLQLQTRKDIYYYKNCRGQSSSQATYKSHAVMHPADQEELFILHTSG